jgi:hypothetical protein
MILIFTVVIFFTTHLIPVVIITVMLDALGTLLFLIGSIINTNFPVTGVTAMYLTMLACVSNLGRLRSPHLKIIGWLGWSNCSLFGIVLQGIILYKLDDVISWVESGSYTVGEGKVII